MMGHRLEQSGKGGLCSMDQKNRTILVLAIAVTVFAAVFVLSLIHISNPPFERPTRSLPAAGPGGSFEKGKIIP